MSAPNRVAFTVADEDAGRRLDQVLAARVPGLSRRQARVLLDIGGVFIDKRRVKIAGRPMHAGEEVVAVLGGALARATNKPGSAARDEDERRLPPHTIVFEDDDIVVVDKPAGLLTAPTPESDRNNLADTLSRRADPLKRGTLGGSHPPRDELAQAEPALPHADSFKRGTLGGSHPPRDELAQAEPALPHADSFKRGTLGGSHPPRDELAQAEPALPHADSFKRGTLGGSHPPRDELAQAEPALPHATRGEIFVVHRIDLETSGLVVLAKTADANRELSARFRDHDIERVYLTVVLGAFPADLTTVAEPVAGRKAVTHLEVRERLAAGATLLACRLETGRTHQIRIHLAGVGHPVAGDARYGRAWAPAPPRMALHATTLGFAHPRDGRALTFTSPWPPDLTPWLMRLRNNGST